MTNQENGVSMSSLHQHQQRLLNEQNENNELSMTLVERRRRLHDLASEINQWEDESTTTRNHINEKPMTPMRNSTHDLMNRSAMSNYSPKAFNSSITKASPNKAQLSPFNYNIIGSNGFLNKENSYTPNAVHKRKLDDKSTNVNQNNYVPHKISSSSNLSRRDLYSAPLPPAQRASNNVQNQATVVNSSSESIVKNMKSLFENMPQEQAEQENAKLMTPKLLIQKFEALTRDPTSATTASAPPSLPPVVPLKKTSVGNNSKKSSMGSNHSSHDDHHDEPKRSIEKNNQPNVVAVVNKQQQHQQNQQSYISQETIKPKLVIEKFESLVKNNNQQQQQQQMNENRKSDRSEPGSIQIVHHIRFSNDTKSEYHESMKANYGGVNSLTYVSSIASDRSSSQNLNDYDDEEDDQAMYEANYEIAKQSEEGIYEELASTKYDDRELSQEIYGDSDDFNDTEEEEESEDDSEDEEEDEVDENEYTDMPTIQEASQFNNDDDMITATTINNQSELITAPKSSARKSIAKMPNNNITTTNGDLSSFDQTNNTNNESTDMVTDEALVSIKEYRKQKKSHNSGRRRSSAFRMAVPNVNNSNGKSKTAATAAAANKPARAECVDEATRNAKNQERIKELEDLIKQEDNVIYQTGIALERCLNQTQFTGSGEHIECNRLLLIACQKRQAYLTEINRLKKQKESSTSDINKQQQLYPNLSAMNGSFDETTTPAFIMDLTGTLIFSDIQLPIKESYLNKLKSGDEKRIFYFICLLRNGVQVLQTQVISVQELLSGRETAISFPNRMAINNVDVNFKVKIDVYTMEMVPKDPKAHKNQMSLASNATHKFFSPIKNTVLHTLSMAHSSSHNNSSSNSSSSNNSSTHQNNSKNSNHHYNESNSLGSANGCSKTSNFIHVDTIEITSKDLANNKFRLSISSSSIPLTGILYAKVRCTPSKSIELRGFLTIFDDSNGYGSWDRCWCFLNNYNISYWKYPEDEYKSTPLGVFNLSECTNDTVKVLPRDMCARKYTIELVLCQKKSTTAASAVAADQQKQQHSEQDLKRYRLSADNKEQANEWIMHVNWALANLRLWNPKI